MNKIQIYEKAIQGWGSWVYRRKNSYSPPHFTYMPFPESVCSQTVVSITVGDPRVWERESHSRFPRLLCHHKLLFGKMCFNIEPKVHTHTNIFKLKRKLCEAFLMILKPSNTYVCACMPSPLPDPPTLHPYPSFSCCCLFCLTGSTSCHRDFCEVTDGGLKFHFREQEGIHLHSTTIVNFRTKYIRMIMTWIKIASPLDFLLQIEKMVEISCTIFMGKF